MFSRCSVSRFDAGGRPLSTLVPGARGTVIRVTGEASADRLAALGVTPGAVVLVLQTFPGIVFECDQTELAVERRVARGIYIEVQRPATYVPGPARAVGEEAL